MGAFLKGGRITLRSISPEDKKLFLIWHNDPEMRNDIGGVFPFTEHDYIAICNASGIEMPLNVWFAVCLDDSLIGIAGLHNIKYIQRNAEIALLIGDSKYRNKGYGTCILELLVGYAFHTLNLHRVYEIIFSENIPSIHLAEKCSFVREGILHEANYWNGVYRDVVLYARLNPSHSSCVYTETNEKQNARQMPKRK